MARIASTTSAGVPVSDPTGGMTIDALMARQKMLAEQAGQIAAPRQMISPWQGAAQLGQTFVNSLKEHQTEDQLKAGRAALAQIMSGIDPSTGATSEQTGQAYQIDPDLGLKLMEQAVQARREAAAQQLHASERQQDRQWTVTDADRARQDAIANREDQQTFQSGQTTRQEQFQSGQQERSQKFAAEQAAAGRAKYGPVVTGDAAKALGLDGTKSYQLNETTGQYDPIGTGQGVTINTGDMSSALTKQFDTDEGKSWAAYLDAGAKAGATMNDLTLLDQLGKVAPQGPLPGTLAKMFPGISNAGAAFQSIVKRVAPTMRATGSGSTSDIEYNGMLDSLPKLTNYPEANALISGMMKAKAEIDLKRADIVTNWRNGQMKDAEARVALRDLQRQSIMSPELEALIANASQADGSAPGAAPAAPGGGWTVEEMP